MFITTFEILKDSMVDRIRNLYTNGWDQSEPTVGPGYADTALTQKKSTPYALRRMST